MTANERRAEIIRILVSRRRETMGQLAQELGVSVRTIRTDMALLAVKYPLKTVRGNGGCVKLADGYNYHEKILSQEQETVLTQMLDRANEPQQRVLREMIAAFGA